MIKSQFKKNEGFSLIEVLTALVVITMLLSLLLSGLIYVNTIDKKMAIDQKLFYNERYLNLYFQKQILRSEKIYVKHNRVYLQDLESPEHYNYYQYSNGFLRRYKVSGDGLILIGSGSNSQFADSIQSFSLSLGSDQEIILKYSLAVEGMIYYRETTISHGRMVEFV